MAGPGVSGNPDNKSKPWETLRVADGKTLLDAGIMTDTDAVSQDTWANWMPDIQARIDAYNANVFASDKKRREYEDGRQKTIALANNNPGRDQTILTSAANRKFAQTRTLLT